MGTDLILSTVEQEQVARLEEAAIRCRTEMANTAKQFGAAFAIARLTRQLDNLVSDEMMEDVMALQGHSLGFRTDKDNKPDSYPVEVVRPVFIEATIRGFRMVDNEVNIIAGRFYAAKNGVRRKVREFPGLSNFIYSIGVPERQGQRALTACVASWFMDGMEGKYVREPKRRPDGTVHDDRIVSRVNEGMLDAAIIGKVERTMYRDILETLEGYETPVSDMDDDQSSPQPKRIQRSTLFDESPVSTPAESQPNQDEVIAEYDGRLADAEFPRDVAKIAKEAGADKRLTLDSRKGIMEACTWRRKSMAGAG